jgi:hypothetical protein
MNKAGLKLEAFAVESFATAGDAQSDPFVAPGAGCICDGAPCICSRAPDCVQAGGTV